MTAAADHRIDLSYSFISTAYSLKTDTVAFHRLFIISTNTVKGNTARITAELFSSVSARTETTKARAAVLFIQ